MYECESGTIKKPECQRIDTFELVVLEKTLESPLDCKEVKPVLPKGNQPWVFIGMTHAEAKASILWPPDAKSQLIGKDPGAGKDWGQDEKEVTGQDDGTASPTQWMWVWTNSGRWWRTGKPGMLQSVGSQRVGHDLATEQQLLLYLLFIFKYSFILLCWVLVAACGI